MDLPEMERRLEHRDSAHGAPIAEILVVASAVLEMVIVTYAAWWLWNF